MFALAFVWLIVHCRVLQDVAETLLEQRKPRAFAATNPGGMACLRHPRRRGATSAAAVAAYCVPLAVRAIANFGGHRDTAGADHGGTDLREFPLSPRVRRGLARRGAG